MTDTIEPALTATEWQNLRTNTDALNVMFDASPWGRAPEGNHFREMAIANWKLPDTDPRKITREKLRALDAIISASADHWDKGPPDEGWQSEELSGNVAMARQLRAAIAALLPP